MLLLYCFPNGILGAADDILHFPCSFLCGAFGLGLGVAGDLADSLLDGALYLTTDSNDAIFVHGYFLDCANTNSGSNRRFGFFDRLSLFERVAGERTRLGRRNATRLIFSQERLFPSFHQIAKLIHIETGGSGLREDPV